MELNNVSISPTFKTSGKGWDRKVLDYLNENCPARENVKIMGTGEDGCFEIIHSARESYRGCKWSNIMGPFYRDLNFCDQINQPKKWLPKILDDLSGEGITLSNVTIIDLDANGIFIIL